MKLVIKSAFSEFNVPELDEEQIMYVTGALDKINGATPIFGAALQRYEALLGRLVITRKVQVGDQYIKDYYTIQGEWIGEDARELWMEVVN